ncbi:MAG: aspartate dehydrogenase, partial [Ilumatobacter sp.]
MTTGEPLRLVFIGWGAIARTAAEVLRDAPVEIVAVAVSDGAVTRPELPASARVITDPAELAATMPDVVAEAAGRESVEPWGRATLESGTDFIVSSASAFADARVLDSLRAVASRTGAHIHVQPGALGGVDALSAARAMGIDAVEHRIVKPPAAWRGSPAESLCALDSLTQPEEFF